MAVLADLYIKADVLKTLLDTVNKKGEKGISLTISVNDESNDYGQNLSSYVSQTKEQREEKKPKFYVGNGKVFWTDGKTPMIGVKKEQAHAPKQEYQNDDSDSLPF